MKWKFLALALLPLSVAATDYHVAKTGNDTTGSGSEALPFLTIQKASYIALTDGDRVIVHAGRYTEIETDLDDPGINATGVIPHADGITFMSAPGEHVIIDQQYIPVESPPGTWTLPINTASGREPAGFYTDKYDDIVIDGFEIINAASGVMTGNRTGSGGELPDPDTGGIVAERAIIRNNHMHHINSLGNPAAIRSDSCRECEIYDNVLHDASKVFEGIKYCTNDLECPGFPQNQNTAGILGFDMIKPDIHHNIIYNAWKGIYHKKAGRIDGDVGAESGSIHNNIIYDTNIGIHHSQAGACDYAHKAVRIYENLLYYVNHTPMTTGISATLSESANPSGISVIYNNTIIADQGIFYDSFDDVRIFNNVFKLTNGNGIAIGRYVLTPDVDTCVEPDDTYGSLGPGPPFSAVFQLSDYNLIDTGHRFRVGDDFYSLTQWQTGGTGNCTLNATSGTCGLNSIEDTPLFISKPSDGDQDDAYQYFRLDTGSPGLDAGKTAVSDKPTGATIHMGAYPLGADSWVGPRDAAKSVAKITDFAGV